MSDIEIDKMLTCITTHMTEDEAVAFDEGNSQIGRFRSIWKCEYGYMFWVGDASEANVLLNRQDGPVLSVGLRDAIVFAAEHGCPYIRFDRDAEPLPEVHTYDW